MKNSGGKVEGKRGLLITVEGVHGSGKSTLLRMLFIALKRLGLNVILTSDQAGTKLSRKIRKINLERNSNIDVITEALLVAAASRQNISEIIKHGLSQGQIVLCERYCYDAYFAFHEYARGLSKKFVEFIISLISEGITPDLTILLDADPKTALTRLNSKRLHRIEKETLEFHIRVREDYLIRAQKYPERIKIINANLPINEVFEKAWKIVREFLIQRGFKISKVQQSVMMNFKG